MICSYLNTSIRFPSLLEDTSLSYFIISFLFRRGLSVFDVFPPFLCHLICKFQQEYEKKQIKMWKTMNDAQHMWIVGSFFKFRHGGSCAGVLLVGGGGYIVAHPLSPVPCPPSPITCNFVIRGWCNRFPPYFIQSSSRVAIYVDDWLLYLVHASRSFLVHLFFFFHPSSPSFFMFFFFWCSPFPAFCLSSADAGWDNLKGYDLSPGGDNVLTKFVGGSSNLIFVVQASIE